MKRITLLCLGLFSLAACNRENTPVGLTATNLRTIENTCTALEGEKYLALAFNYTGKLDSLKFSFTPFLMVASPLSTTQIVRIADVNTVPSSYAKVLLNESTVAKVYLSLPDAVLSSAGITPPDPKQTRPMSIRLEVSNTAGQSAAALELKDVDVSGCY
ncbi:MAG: hypothetical protein H7095_02145 [Pseudopedobacter sp.]|nr:hypothetical protein [Deinococcales bacterium]